MKFSAVLLQEKIKTTIWMLILGTIFWMLPTSVTALQTASLRASDGNVYQIRFRNIDPGSYPGSRYYLKDFIRDLSIYNTAGEELCLGNDEEVTWELYTAARFLAKTPRQTPIFDTSALVEDMIQTADDLGIDQEGNVKVGEIVGEIIAEMVVDEIEGQIQSSMEPSLDFGNLSINTKTFKITVNVSGEPLFLAKSVDFLARLINLEIEGHKVIYAFSKASQYANIAIHLQVLANQKAEALWNTIDAGGIVDIAGHPFTTHEETGEVSDAIGVFDPFRLRLAAQVYEEYAEHAVALGTGKQEGHPVIPENPTNIELIDSLLSTASSAANALKVKDALDDLDTQLTDDILRRLREYIENIYNGAASDLQQHGFCEEMQHLPSKPVDPNPSENVANDPPLPNHRPESYRQIDPQNFRIGDDPKWRNLTSYFSDPDGDILIYRANSSNDRIVVATIEDNSVKTTPGEVGTATVTVTAEDPGGLTKEQSFRVTVQAKLETIPSLPVCDRTPQVREEIMKKTGDNNCANVTEDELESITSLRMTEKNIGTLQQGDFDELHNLEDLVLKGNFLSTLPEDVFWYLGNLKKLSLRNNQFTILAEDTFEHLDSLTYLSLRGNPLATLQQGAFEDLDMLIELDLRDNQLTTLPAGVFEDLFNLEELNLENNHISILTNDGFLGLSNLEDLYLEENPLQTIETGAFNGLTNLTDLNLSGLPLQTIEAGAFNGLTNLTDLELYDAQLSTLTRNVFVGLSSLDDLGLSGNPLQTIEAGAFNGLTNLTDLNLSGLPLQTIEAGIFNGLTNLTDLDLADAQLSTLARDVFLSLSNLESLDLDGNTLRTIEVGAFNGLSSLTSLYLCQNQLTMLQVGTFSGLNNLTRLRLDENQFATLPAGIFNGLIKLSRLNLNENQLTTLPAGVFAGLSDLTYLNLQDNPGSPFTLVLELTRTDNVNQTASGPAMVKVKLAEGAPFKMNISLSVEGGTLSANTATIAKGSTESGDITVIQSGIGPTTVNLGIAPTIPSNYFGIQMAVGSSLVLFDKVAASADINGDGTVNILDLVLVTADIGKTGINDTDVNGDGTVNILDLVFVAANFSSDAAAPLPYPNLQETFTAADVQHWLSQASQLNLTDATSQKGIRILEQLLVALVPKHTLLLPNYPNPFNPETWMPYQLAKSADVKISIYAADGKLIRMLDLGHQPIGIYQGKSRAAYWDGKNRLGEPVASGVYFYTLTAGGFTATRKMLIRK